MNKDLVLHTSLIKTIRFNIVYFGWGGILHPKVLISRNVSLKKMKGQVVVAKDVPLGGIKIGYGNTGIIDRHYERSVWENSGTIEFKGKATINTKSRIACAGHLIIGENCHFNGGSNIICWENICIGSNCFISWECLIMDTDFHDLKDKYNLNIINPNKPIVIGDHVWIGCRTTILKGTVIPPNSIIAACSVVTKKLKNEESVYVGNKCIKENVVW